MTIHKSQGLTIDKIFLDLGKTEFSENATFVAQEFDAGRIYL